MSTTLSVQDTSRQLVSDADSAETALPPAFRFSDTDTSGIAFPEVPAVADSFRLFSGHVLKPVNSVPVPLARRTPDWFTVVLLLVVIGFSGIRTFYYKIFRQLISAFFNNNVTNQIVRDENILVQRAASLMSVLFYFIFSLFLYQVSVYYKWSFQYMGTGFTRFFFLTLAVAFAYSVKLLTLKSAGGLFNADKAVATYIFNIFLINNLLGLALLPVVILAAYVVPVWWMGDVLLTGVIIAISFFAYRQIRGFLVWRTSLGGGIFYFILYLCTLEIAPLLIIFKLAGA
jgi:hypothetical protein